MCGRYALVNEKKVFLTFEVIKKLRETGVAFNILPRYNASPMQKMPVIAIRDGELKAHQMQWWLIPHYSKDGKPIVVERDGRKEMLKTFNAKAETLEQSKLFSPYFKGSRCLVPADAFYEWEKTTATKEIQGQPKQIVEKQPMCIRMKDEQPFMFAGLFSVWKNDKEEKLSTFTIVTTEPNELMVPIHNRMPVILHEKDFEQWLDRDYKDTATLKKLLVPYPAKKMKAYRVSTLVSNSRNDVPECMEPLKEK